MVFPMELRRPLTGIIPPLVTPLAGRDRLDEDGLERLIERTISAGVSGIFVLGTTGEAPSLSYRLKQDMIEKTCGLTRERVPVLAGITDPSFVDSIDLARHAAQCGASAVVLSAPFYYTTGQPELLEYLEHIVPELPLPVYLYNIPSLTKNTFEPDVVLRAAELGVLGLKDSSGDLDYFRAMREAFANHRDFALMIGPEEMLAQAIAAGATGGVCGGANLWPQLYIELYRAAVARDFPEVERLHGKVMEISNGIYRVGRHPSSYLKGLKCALSLLGICDDFMAEPFHRFREAEREIIRARLIEIGLLR
jgi:dihydrodipicolinate synthase/N-acetylneuraminate lyase